MIRGGNFTTIGIVGTKCEANDRIENRIFGATTRFVRVWNARLNRARAGQDLTQSPTANDNEEKMTMRGAQSPSFRLKLRK
jgi:hypothetical protein